MVKKTAETWTTAADFKAELETDPEFRTQRERRRAAQKLFAEQLREAQRPLLNDLSRVGFQVETVEDVATWPEPYPAAIPVLLEHLRRDYPPLVRMAIARALAVPAARMVWPILVEIFEELPTDGPDVKYAVGNALAEAADDSVMDDLQALLRDTRHGDSRLALLEPFLKRQSTADRALLTALSSDPDLRREIRRRMGRPGRRRPEK